VDQLLYGAIDNRRMLRFRYKGKERVVEPNDYGVQNGIVRLLCWQVGGQSTSPLPGWRLMDVKDMKECELLEKQFSGGKEVPGPHLKWDKIFIRVAPSKKE
jgi:hypothetical protein